MVRKTGKGSKKGAPPKRGSGGRQAAGADRERHHDGFSLRDEEVEDALISGAHRDLLEDYFGEDTYAELRDLATRSKRAQVRGGPRVLVLPGIMGSKLGTEGLLFDNTLWLDPVDVIAGRLDELTLGRDDDIVALGVLLFTYLKMKLRLRIAGFDADFHPFDWRKSIAELGAELAARIERETDRNGTLVPLYLVAHSMGGLVCRAALTVLDQVAESERITRLIMLGTPNYGSFSPVQALSGYHSLVRKVSALDLEHSEAQLVNEVFNTFPGLYEMLPAPDRNIGVDLQQPDNWPPTGIAPRPELLAAAPGIHEQLAPNDERMVLIAGIDQETVVGVRREGDEFVFSQSLEGDGTVPLAFARLDGVKTYFIDEQHGSLMNNRDAARAVIDILETGSTDVLPTQWSPRRRGESWEVSRAQLAPEPFGERTGRQITRRELRHIVEEFAAPASAAGATAEAVTGVELSALSTEPIVIGRQRQARFDIRLARGDITQVDSRAVVLGLFAGVPPGGAATAIDRQLDFAISDFTERRLISANVGEVFIMPANRYRVGADLVVFAGLGSYDEFSEEVLRIVGENVARALVRTKVDEFATVLLGSGSGLKVEDVLENLVEGFLRGVQDLQGRSSLRAVTFCERDPHRFERLHRRMLQLSTAPLFDGTEVTIDAFDLPPAPPAPARDARSPTSAPSVFLMVREYPNRIEAETDPSLATSFVLRASVLTAGSKATVVTDSIEIDATRLNRHLEVIETRDFGFDGLDAFGAELAELVLPALIRETLAGLRDYHLVVINDARTSRIPWETVNLEGAFPAATSGVSRKYEAANLTVAKWLEERRLAAELRVLLIVNPTGDLSGAEREGNRIAETLAEEPAVRVDELRGAQATFSAIRAAFRSGAYDVVHYAGHAFFDPLNLPRSGIVCHGHQVLSGGDLAGLERLPALMFFNACESGRVRRGSPARVRSQRDRARGRGTAERLQTNVGFAEALLRAGVGNYIGTYWPVGDLAAEVFGRVFYGEILGGATLGEALQAGRRQILAERSVDWADYILYGSQDFVVKRNT
jgi:pimeloyl-ACP methyl ester carboxylesterase